nr:hypothetical protein [Tanacetum cinerariifolium]
GFSGVETPLFENMLVVRAVDAEEEVQVSAHDDDAQENVIEEVAAKVVPPTPTSPSPPSPVLEKCTALVLRVEGLENTNAAQKLEIVKLKARVMKLEKLNKVKSSKLKCLKKVGTSQRIESSEDEENVFNQGRISVDIDEGIELDVEDTEVQEAVEVVTTAKLITEVVTAASTQVATASTPIPAAKLVVKPKVLKFAAAAPAVSTRKRKGVVIRDLEEELHDDTPAKTLSVKDKGKGILVEDPKPMKKKDQIDMDAEYAKKLQEEELEKGHEEAYKNIDWNTAFDHVQAKDTREEMEKEEEEIIKSINETPAQKAAKRRKRKEEAQRLSEEAQKKTDEA